MILSSKKGAIGADILMFVILTFVIILVVGILFWVYTLIKPGVVEMIQTNQGKEIVNNNYESFPSIFDYGILFIVTGAWVLVIVGSFLIDTNPMYLIIGIIVLAMSFLIAIYLANIYSDITESDPDLEFMRTSFPISYWIMQHLLQLSIFVGCTAAIALYGKSRMG